MVKRRIAVYVTYIRNFRSIGYALVARQLRRVRGDCTRLKRPLLIARPLYASGRNIARAVTISFIGVMLFLMSRTTSTAHSTIWDGCSGGKGAEAASISGFGFFGLETASLVAKPAVISRTSWGCPDGQSSPRWTPQTTSVSHLIIHHSATANSSADWPAVVRSIWNNHTFTRGWGDIGYNYLIDPNGNIYEGRAGGDNVIGAHFSCQNGNTMGVCILGTYTTASPTTAAVNSLKQLLAWKASQREIDPLGSAFHRGTQLVLPNIAGHRDGNPSYPDITCSSTECPGGNFYGQLPAIRNAVKALIDADPPDTTRPGIAALSVTPGSVTTGNVFTIAYTVSDSGGSGLRRVELWRATGSGSATDPSWRSINTNAASANGPVSGSFNDAPPAGTYWYGLRAVDNATNIMDERTAGVGPLRRIVTTNDTASPARHLTEMAVTNSYPRFRLNGFVGSNYLVEASSDLVNWSPLSTHVIPAGGSIIITDASGTDQQFRFYRAMLTNAVANSPPQSASNSVILGDR